MVIPTNSPILNVRGRAKAPEDYMYQLAPGTVLTAASKTRYRILKPMTKGSFGELYLAQAKSSRSAQHSSLVVVKVPRIDEDQTLPEKFYQIGNLLRVFALEKCTMERLHGLNCVPQLLDSGPFNLRVPRTDLKLPALFLVLEYIEGKPLEAHLNADESLTPSNGFHGICDAKKFFSWARKLASAVDAIHQKLVVHGDIWQENILITPAEEIKIIDFGQALFRDLTFGKDSLQVNTHPCVPPEKKRSVTGDIYSVGAVLYYLATGKQLTSQFRHLENIDNLKRQISEDIKEANAQLYRNHSGVVDVVCRCLRCNPRERTPQALGLLNDIEMMDPHWPETSPFEQPIPEMLRQLDEKEIPFFSRIARRRARELESIIQNMIVGVYDLTGDHEEIVSGLSEYVALLGPGDEYLTISIPSVWSEKNLGVNGRFLTLNKEAAKRGASIRRIFLVTEELRKDPETLSIIQSHVDALVELDGLGIETKAIEGAGGYSCSFLIVTEERLEAMVTEDKHFGLLAKDGRELVVFPIYRGDGSLVSLQFRSDAAVAASVRRDFCREECGSVDLRKFLPGS